MAPSSVSLCFSRKSKISRSCLRSVNEYNPQPCVSGDEANRLRLETLESVGGKIPGVPSGYGE